MATIKKVHCDLCGKIPAETITYSSERVNAGGYPDTEIETRDLCIEHLKESMHAFINDPKLVSYCESAVTFKRKVEQGLV